VGQAAGDVAAGPAPERGLDGLVGAVDREADPVEIGRVRGEQLRQPGAVADDAGDEAEPARLGEQRADVRVEGRLTAGEVELLAAGLAEQAQQGQGVLEAELAAEVAEGGEAEPAAVVARLVEVEVDGDEGGVLAGHAGDTSGPAEVCDTASKKKCWRRLGPELEARGRASVGGHLLVGALEPLADVGGGHVQTAAICWEVSPSKSRRTMSRSRSVEAAEAGPEVDGRVELAG
jgi:hypothetical protein